MSIAKVLTIEANLSEYADNVMSHGDTAYDECIVRQYEYPQFDDDTTDDDDTIDWDLANIYEIFGI